MIRKLLTITALLAAGCSESRHAGGLTPIAHPLIDNLYILQAAGTGMTANSAGGSFALQGRCLLFKNAGAMTTPLFALGTDVQVSTGGVTIGGHLFHYGQSYSFPGLGPPRRMQLSSQGCPQIASVIVGIQAQPVSVPPPPAPHPSPS